MAQARRPNLPIRPQSCLFNIPEQYRSTIDGKRFLLTEETPIRREGLLLFTSDKQLDLLFNSDTIVMDGTFSRSPPHFKQIFIIHAIYIDIYVRTQTVIDALTFPLFLLRSMWAAFCISAKQFIDRFSNSVSSGIMAVTNHFDCYTESWWHCHPIVEPSMYIGLY